MIYKLFLLLFSCNNPEKNHYIKSPHHKNDLNLHHPRCGGYPSCLKILRTRHLPGDIRFPIPSFDLRLLHIFFFRSGWPQHNALCTRDVERIFCFLSHGAPPFFFAILSWRTKRLPTLDFSKSRELRTILDFSLYQFLQI